MKQLIAFIILLIPFYAFSQTERTASIESRVDSVECKGVVYTTLYYNVIQEVTQNGTSSPDTTISKVLIKNGECPADSANIAYQMEVSAINSQQEISYYVKKALERPYYSALFNNISARYLSFTGKTLDSKLSELYLDQYNGIYRVFKSDGSSFFAIVVQLPNGSLRLREVVSPGNLTEVTPLNQYVFQIRTKDSFRLNAFEGRNRDFTFAKLNGNKKIYFPDGKIANFTGAMRIVEVGKKP